MVISKTTNADSVRLNHQSLENELVPGSDDPQGELPDESQPIIVYENTS